uniref:Uncharacterized protein n=1 Tax=Anopheles atroparvus TaxID=41427 RepID=A0A182IPJ4_ANOAO
MVLQERFWPLIELHSGRCWTEPATRLRRADTLYVLSLRAVVCSFANNPRGVGYRMEIERLPLSIRLDVLYEMCDHPALVEVLLQLLSDPVALSDLIQYVPLKTAKLVSCLQWLESVKRSLPAQLEDRYRQLVEADTPEQRTDYRCGLRIGTFLADAGWFVHAAAILGLSLQQTVSGSDEELIVLTQLLGTLSRSGKLVEAGHFYHRINLRMMVINPQDQNIHRADFPDLMARVYHNLSLYHYENQEVALSYLHGVQSLEMLGRSSPTRLVWDVFRQLARACLSHRYFSKAKLLLDQALARAGTGYGLTSAPYAETLEDYAVYLLAQDNVDASEDVFSVAQFIYLELFGSRNLLLSLAQGSLTFGLCRQAFAMGRRDEALAHVTERLGAFQRMMGPDHRLVVQLRRLLVTMRVILFKEDRLVGRILPRNATTSIDVKKLRETLDHPLPIDAVRKAFHECQE